MTDYRKAAASFVFFVKLTSLWNPLEEAAVWSFKGFFTESHRYIYYRIENVKEFHIVFSLKLNLQWFNTIGFSCSIWFDLNKDFLNVKSVKYKHVYLLQKSKLIGLKKFDYS